MTRRPRLLGMLILAILLCGSVPVLLACYLLGSTPSLGSFPMILLVPVAVLVILTSLLEVGLARMSAQSTQSTRGPAALVTPPVSRPSWGHVLLPLVVGALLALLGGTVTSLWVAYLPEPLRPLALLLFPGVPVAAILAPVVLARREGAQLEIDDNRARSLRDLGERYTRLLAEDRLREGARSALGLEVEPPALSQPTLALHAVGSQHEGARKRQLPPGTAIGQVYDNADGRLLILGGPGSGKTTRLVDLALDLLAWARADATQPLPVIFNLSNWSTGGSLLGYWLMDELVKRYKVPRRVAHSWIAEAHIVPLLDGLDELEEDRRTSCVQAINYYLRVHEQLPLVVCSSPAAEYKARRTPLALTSRVVIQALSDEQILGYLALGGEPLSALRERVETDRSLRASLRSPFMVRLATVTYAGRPQGEIPSGGDCRALREQLLQAYVTSMLDRPGGREVGEADVPDLLYGPEATKGYLRWLASQMDRHEIGTLSPAEMQPDWLPDVSALLRYRITRDVAIGLEVVAFLVITSVMQYLIVGSPLGVLVYFLGLAVAVIVALIVVLMVILVDRYKSGSIRPIAARRWIWLAPALGLGAGLVFGLSDSGSGMQASAGFNALVSPLILGLIGGLAVVVQYSVLHRQLRRSGVVPLHLDHFLEYAAGRMLLQRVSGGYRFTHLLLRDYLLRDYFLDAGAQ